MIKFMLLAKSKLNGIEILIWQSLIDMNISHEEFIKVLKEKDKYEKMKDNSRSENEEYVSNDSSCKATYEIMRLSSIKSKI